MLWDRVQQRHKNRNYVRPRKRKDLYSLTGKIVCGKCGAHFFGIRSASVQRGKKYDYKYYVCSTSKTYHTCSCKSVRKDFLEKAVLDEIKKYILNEKARYQIANDIVVKLGENPDAQKNKLKEFKKELTTVKSQISELLDLKSLRLVDNVYLVEHMKPLQEKAKELEVQIYAIEQQTKMTISHAMIVDYLCKMMDISDTTDDEILQTIFNNFVEKIVIGNETIEVSLFVSPTLEKFGDKFSQGQPQWSYCSKIKRV
jgi:hypothetical protein